MTEDSTHDPTARSWVESATPDSGFPVQNLPFGVFTTDTTRIGVAIGEMILDVTACVEEGLLPGSDAADACDARSLNGLMSLERRHLVELRKELSDLLRFDGALASRARGSQSRILVPMAEAKMSLPAETGDYTDFYASIDHASNVGSMFRPDNPLLPNYKYVPIGYHGRASSLFPSGTGVVRPRGQTKAADADAPAFGPTRMLDYESELGFFVRRGNEPGAPIPLDSAQDHIFGFCLVNDWSARDIQSWEYQPLGPFLSKNFATSLSPWVVTAEAADAYRVPAAARPAGDPEPLDYLSSAWEKRSGGISAFLEVYLLSAAMRAKGVPPLRLSRAPFASMYWTVGQMLAHHASNGCNLRAGDLLASGTVSGKDDTARGCLLELTWRGTRPVRLPTGEERKFLEDGDEVIMRGTLEADERPALSLGECRGTIAPAQT